MTASTPSNTLTGLNDCMMPLPVISLALRGVGLHNQHQHFQESIESKL